MNNITIKVPSQVAETVRRAIISCLQDYAMDGGMIDEITIKMKEDGNGEGVKA